MKKEVKWNDLQSANQRELKKTYGLNDRQLETQVRDHLYGANAKERREFYQQFYGRKK